VAVLAVDAKIAGVKFVRIYERLLRRVLAGGEYRGVIEIAREKSERDSGTD
jgi:hypothetical protein